MSWTAAVLLVVLLQLSKTVALGLEGLAARRLLQVGAGTRSLSLPPASSRNLTTAAVSSPNQPGLDWTANDPTQVLFTHGSRDDGMQHLSHRKVPAAECGSEMKQMCDQLKRSYTGVQLRNVLVGRCLQGADPRFKVRVTGFEFPDAATCVEYSTELADISLGENSDAAFVHWCVRVDVAINGPTTTTTTTTTTNCPPSTVDSNLKGIKEALQGGTDEDEATRTLERFRKSLKKSR